MLTFSAFADEIDADLDVQMDTCAANGVMAIDVRAIDNVNVSSMTLAQVKEYKKRLDDRGFEVPHIGSPIGKIRIGDDFDSHKDLVKHTCDVAHAFGTDRIRMFSFYPTEGADIRDQRDEVIDQFSQMLEIAEAQDAVFYHENEADIYGKTPEGVRDLFGTFNTPRLKGIFDPANFVTEHIKAYDEAWTGGLAEMTHALHIKDKVYDNGCVPAGQGDGQFPEIFADLARREFSGYATLEPHLAAAGQFSGHTGPDLFATAVNALKKVCDEAGVAYKKA